MVYIICRYVYSTSVRYTVVIKTTNKLISKPLDVQYGLETYLCDVLHIVQLLAMNNFVFEVFKLYYFIVMLQPFILKANNMNSNMENANKKDSAYKALNSLRTVLFIFKVFSYSISKIKRSQCAHMVLYIGIREFHKISSVHIFSR